MPTPGVPCRRFTAEEDAVILRLAASASYREIAGEIGRQQSSVAMRLRLLAKRGLVKKITSRCKVWTESEDRELLDLLRTYSLEATAALLGRTVPGCDRRLQSLGVTNITEYRLGGKAIDLPEAARLLGVNVQMVRQWRLKGYLETWRLRDFHRSPHYVHPAALYSFIREYPALYSVHVMPDSSYRQHAILHAARNPPERDMLPKAVARLRGCSVGTVHRAIRSGRLPAHRVPGVPDELRIKRADAERWTPTKPGQHYPKQTTERTAR